MISRRSAIGFLALAAMAAAPIGSATAADYPTRPVKWVVGYPPGGATDIIARKLAPAMQQQLGQSVFIENRPGANARIGANVVALFGAGY